MSEPKHFWDLRTPLESHMFNQDPKNDFLCTVCKKPRAMHRDPAAVMEIKPESPPVQP